MSNQSKLEEETIFDIWWNEISFKSIVVWKKSYKTTAETGQSFHELGQNFSFLDGLDCSTSIIVS